MADPDYSILSGFQGQINRPKTSLFYHVGLVLVTGTMLLLPVIYLAMVGAVAYAVYYHAVHNFGPIMNSFALGGLLKFLVYFAPLLAGVVVVFFMFKPLLARQPRHAQPLALNPATERLLYAFIEKICDVVGAPSPKRIDLDCRINAAAGFRRGYFSMLGNDLVLVLGLPLVANLTARELAGVIAHEFGHFTQGAGMRLSYVITRINVWFIRVCYQRDSWDEALESWAARVRDGRVALIVWTIQLSVWFSRLILKLLMLIGHAVCGFMTRQMEYDADAYEIKVAGSECFERTMRKLATLDAAWGATQKQLVQSWRQTKTLPDNLPEMIRNSHQKLSPALLQRIDDTLGFHRTKLFDSHPSPADRIRQARRAADPRIFHDDRPASSLFASFEHPSRFVTLLHYTDNLGIPITEKMLTRVETRRDVAAVAGGVQTKQPYSLGGAVADDLLHSYFLGILPLMKPLRLDLPVASTKLDADYAELSQLAASLQQIAPQLAAFAQQDAEFSEQLASVRAAHCLLNNGFDVSEGMLSLPKMDLETAAAAEAEAVTARQNLRHSLREVVPSLKRRLELGLRLAMANVGEPALGDSNSAAELVAFFNDNADNYSRRQELAEAILTLDKIKNVKSTEGEDSAMRRTVAAQENFIASLSDKLNPQTDAARAGVDAPKLQIAKSSADITGIRTKNREWLQNYDRKLGELVRLVMPAESFTPA